MPSDALSETKACDLLARLFRARGYTIERNIPFAELGVSFHIDGWDPSARVGFEFLSSEDEDHDDLTLKEYQTLMAAQQRGELALFVIDEVEPLSSDELREAAEEFLDEVATAVKARRKPAKAKAKKAVSKAKPRAGSKVAVSKTRTKAKTPKARTKKASRR
jgi:hypothetical protein